MSYTDSQAWADQSRAYLWSRSRWRRDGRAARARQSGSMHQAHEGGPPFTTGRWLAMTIPQHMLSPEALHRSL